MKIDFSLIRSKKKTRFVRKDVRNNMYESHNFIVNKIFITELKNSCKLNFIDVRIDDKIVNFNLVKINIICLLLPLLHDIIIC